MSILFLCMAISCLIVGGGAFIWGLKQSWNSRQVFDRLNQAIDQAISGGKLFTHYDETYPSQIEEKLNRFLSIQQQQTEKNRAEKQQVKELIGTISHQTKTPLTNVMLYSQLLLEEKLEPQAKAFGKEIFAQSEKLQFFIDSLVKTAYLDEELIQIHKVKQPIEKVLAHAVESVQAAAVAKEIQVHIIPSAWMVCYDFRWTLEALVNVLDNGIKYAPEQTELQLDVERYESFYRINIRDEGPGIEEVERAQIFERFYRGMAVRQTEGAGIGLYLVREIISRQGGFVKVSNREKVGACFSLFLPR